ncbi:MAG: hypothetical protein QM767_02510 [Anaeromyxobacter sp.]
MQKLMLAALAVALGCVTPRTAQEPAPDVGWLQACVDAGDDAACMALARADLARRQHRRAAAALEVACLAEPPVREACAALAPLYKKGKGVPRDAARATLLSARAGDAPALEPLTTSGRAVTQSQDQARAWRAAFLDIWVSDKERSELAVDADQYVAQAPAGLQGDVAALTLAAKTRALRCDEPGGEKKLPLLIAFSVGDDGRPRSVRAISDADAPLPATTGACLQGAVAGWELAGLVPGGPQQLLRVVVSVRAPWPVAAAPEVQAPPPAREPTRYTKPRPEAPPCVGLSVSIPRHLLYSSRTVQVRFAVRRDGSVGQFVPHSPMELPLASAIKRAVEFCRWIPGTDPIGRPATMWVILPLRLSP